MKIVCLMFADNSRLQGRLVTACFCSIFIVTLGTLNSTHTMRFNWFVSHDWMFTVSQ